MKVNIILSNENENSITDANIINFLFKKIKHNLDVKIVNINSFKCDNASINLFIGIVNPLLYPFAKTNMLLIDNNLFPKSYMFSLKNIDYVFTKTSDIASYLSNFIQKDQIIDIGWRSTDLKVTSAESDFSKYLLFCHDANDQAVYRKIITTWNQRLSDDGFSGKLHVVNFGLTKMNISEITASNIIIENTISQEAFERLFNTCGVHICLPEHFSFSHYLNQSMLCRSVVIIPDQMGYKDFTANADGSFGDYGFFVTGRESKHKTLFGTKFSFNEDSFLAKVNEVSKVKRNTLENLGQQARSDALRNHARNNGLFKDHMTSIIKKTLSKPKTEMLKNVLDDNLPTVSIVTLTHNRKKFFRMAILNYNQIEYPKQKLEWIIYDTSNSENCVEDMLPGENDRSKYNIKYFKSDAVETIGESRNFAMRQCQNDIIVFFDDDDYYPAESVKKRVTPLIHDSSINLVACSAIGTFAINKYKSFVDYPSITGTPSKRFRIATLALRRAIIGKNDNFWCDNTSINEFHSIFSSNLRSIQEINWEGVIVSLVHSQNTTHRVIPKSEINERGEEVNECHFGFGNKLFKFITELDISDEELQNREKIKLEKQKELMAQQLASTPPDQAEGNNGATEEISEVDGETN